MGALCGGDTSAAKAAKLRLLDAGKIKAPSPSPTRYRRHLENAVSAVLRSSESCRIPRVPTTISAPTSPNQMPGRQVLRTHPLPLLHSTPFYAPPSLWDAAERKDIWGLFCRRASLSAGVVHWPWARVWARLPVIVQPEVDVLVSRVVSPHLASAGGPSSQRRGRDYISTGAGRYRGTTQQTDFCVLQACATGTGSTPTAQLPPGTLTLADWRCSATPG